jgi:HEAT repeat protein
MPPVCGPGDESICAQFKKRDSASAYDIIPFLTRIATDKNEEPMVVSQAINSLSRIHYNGINDKLLQMVENWNREPPLKVKSASESLARAKDKRVIPVLMEIINLSDNLDTFVTAVYSLGLMGPVEMIAPVVNNYDRFGVLGKGACRGALRRNRELLKEIIAKKKPGPIMPSVIALGLIRDESALPYLASLLRDGAFDKKIISNTIHQIEVYTNEEKRAGNETNSSLRIY